MSQPGHVFCAPTHTKRTAMPNTVQGARLEAYGVRFGEIPIVGFVLAVERGGKSSSLRGRRR